MDQFLPSQPDAPTASLLNQLDGLPPTAYRVGFRFRPNLFKRFPRFLNVHTQRLSRQSQDLLFLSRNSPGFQQRVWHNPALMFQSRLPKTVHVGERRLQNSVWHYFKERGAFPLVRELEMTPQPNKRPRECLRPT